MKKASMSTTAGMEVEFNGDTDAVAEVLGHDGWCFPQRHDYHCNCETCQFQTGLLWRYQRDSSVTGGEFITRIVTDWPTLRHAGERLEHAIGTVNDRVDPDFGEPVSVGQNTGLHVHVGSRIGDWNSLVLAYLRYERYIQHLGAGPFPDKREGMNMTMLNAVREQLRQLGHDPKAGRKLDWERVGQFARNQIAADRHVDLNYSRRNSTFEFRVFNATTVAWQMELAARLAVAFTRFSYNQAVSEAEFIFPAPSLATVVPKMSIERFVAKLCEYDDDLKDLIDRKLAESGEPRIPEEDEPEQLEPFDLPPLVPPGDMYLHPSSGAANARRMRGSGYTWDEDMGEWRWVGRDNVPPPEPVVAQPRRRVTPSDVAERQAQRQEELERRRIASEERAGVVDRLAARIAASQPRTPPTWNADLQRWTEPLQRWTEPAVISYDSNGIIANNQTTDYRINRLDFNDEDA